MNEEDYFELNEGNETPRRNADFYLDSDYRDRVCADPIYNKKVKPNLETFTQLSESIFSHTEVEAHILEPKSYPDRCSRLYDDACIRNINPDNLFDEKNLDWKRHILRTVMHYTRLSGYASLRDASDQAIAHAYQKAYYAAPQLKKRKKKDN
ncbi:MAG: hypothetical protein AABX16_03500 [Nanoarchaeota archaeon]